MKKLIIKLEAQKTTTTSTENGEISIKFYEKKLLIRIYGIVHVPDILFVNM